MKNHKIFLLVKAPIFIGILFFLFSISCEKEPLPSSSQDQSLSSEPSDSLALLYQKASWEVQSSMIEYVNYVLANREDYPEVIAAVEYAKEEIANLVMEREETDILDINTAGKVEPEVLISELHQRLEEGLNNAFYIEERDVLNDFTTATVKFANAYQQISLSTDPSNIPIFSLIDDGPGWYIDLKLYEVKCIKETPSLWNIGDDEIVINGQSTYFDTRAFENEYEHEFESDGDKHIINGNHILSERKLYPPTNYIYYDLDFFEEDLTDDEDFAEEIAEIVKKIVDAGIKIAKTTGRAALIAEGIPPLAIDIVFGLIPFDLATKSLKKHLIKWMLHENFSPQPLIFPTHVIMSNNLIPQWMPFSSVDGAINWNMGRGGATPSYVIGNNNYFYSDPIEFTQITSKNQDGMTIDKDAGKYKMIICLHVRPVSI